MATCALGVRLDKDLIGLAAKTNRMIGNYRRENIATYTESHMQHVYGEPYVQNDVQKVRKFRVLGLGWPKIVLWSVWRKCINSTQKKTAKIPN